MMATIIVTSNEITAFEVYICLVYVTLLHPVKHFIMTLLVPLSIAKYERIIPAWLYTEKLNLG